MNDVTLADKITFLSNPRAYPEQPEVVDVIETHMSWVFMTPTRVHKMKKPVRLPFLDFTMLEARRRNCEAELVLNRRLAGDVYRGVVPLVHNDDGDLKLGGEGRPVEWLVCMKRLPSDRMLDRLLRENAVDVSDLDAVATLLARFYRDAAPVEYIGEDYRRRLARDIEANCAVLSQPDFDQARGLLSLVFEAQRYYLREAAACLDGRCEQGRIIEAHGDLRPEHICLVTPPVIIDCLEFNREFRLLDPVDELAFLALECEMAGAGRLSQHFFSAYTRETDDQPTDDLIAFYGCNRACLRAKLALWHLEDDPDQSREDWIRKSAGYLTVAGEYARRIYGGN